jgi:hypothetical protein
MNATSHNTAQSIRAMPLRVKPAAGGRVLQHLKMTVDAPGEVVVSNELGQSASNDLTPPLGSGFGETLVRHDEGDVLTEQSVDELVPGARARVGVGAHGFECQPREHRRGTFALVGIETMNANADGASTDVEL